MIELLDLGGAGAGDDVADVDSPEALAAAGDRREQNLCVAGGIDLFEFAGAVVAAAAVFFEVVLLEVAQ